MDGWMDGWVDGWMDGWMDRWMDGWKQATPCYIMNKQRSADSYLQLSISLSSIFIIRTAMVDSESFLVIAS